MTPRRSTRSKQQSSQALESFVASPPRRRRTAAHSSHSSCNDSEPAPQSSVLLSGPSSPAVIAPEPAFPPALFDQLVNRVATEVTRHFQSASSSPAGQELLGPSPAPDAFFKFGRDVSSLTADHRGPRGQFLKCRSSCAVSSCWQSLSCGPGCTVAQSVHSSLAGGGPSIGAFQPKNIFTSTNLPVDARVPLKNTEQ